MVIIKKYSNRRLYNTEKKEYITLDELALMIRSGQDIQVIDNETQKDITQETLIQIIFQNIHGVFSSQVLHQLIRMQQQQLQEFFQMYLETGLDYFSKFKQHLGQQADMLGKFWMASWNPFPASNLQSTTPAGAEASSHETTGTRHGEENNKKANANTSPTNDRAPSADFSIQLEQAYQRIRELEREIQRLQKKN